MPNIKINSPSFDDITDITNCVPTISFTREMVDNAVKTILGNGTEYKSAISDSVKICDEVSNVNSATACSSGYIDYASISSSPSPTNIQPITRINVANGTITSAKWEPWPTLYGVDDGAYIYDANKKYAVYKPMTKSESSDLTVSAMEILKSIKEKKEKIMAPITVMKGTIVHESAIENEASRLRDKWIHDKKEQELEKFKKQVEEELREKEANDIADKFTPTNIIYSDPVTIVFWKDGTKTIVRKKGRIQFNKYHAFTAALAKKILRNNTVVNKIVESGTDEKAKKAKKDIKKPSKKETKGE